MMFATNADLNNNKNYKIHVPKAIRRLPIDFLLTSCNESEVIILKENWWQSISPNRHDNAKKSLLNFHLGDHELQSCVDHSKERLFASETPKAQCDSSQCAYSF